MDEILKKISTRELADCIGSTYGFAHQIKTRHRDLPLKHLESVSKQFGIPAKDLRPDIAKIFQESSE